MFWRDIHFVVPHYLRKSRKFENFNLLFCRGRDGLYLSCVQHILQDYFSLVQPIKFKFVAIWLPKCTFASLAQMVLMSRKRIKDLLPRVRFVVRTSNMEMPRRHLSNYVKELHWKACRTCGTTIFSHSPIISFICDVVVS